MQKAGPTTDCDGVPAAGMASKVFTAAVLLCMAHLPSSCQAAHQLAEFLLHAFLLLCLHAAERTGIGRWDSSCSLLTDYALQVTDSLNQRRYATVTVHLIMPSTMFNIACLHYTVQSHILVRSQHVEGQTVSSLQRY